MNVGVTALQSNKIEDDLMSELRTISAFQKEELQRETLIESLLTFFKQLLPDEQRVLQILLNSNHALSLNQIKKQYTINIISTSENVQDIEIFIKKTLKKSISLQMNSKESMLLNDKDIEEITSFYNKGAPDKIPSYYKFKSILEFFELQGIVFRRELKEQKAREVWCLTPSFSKIYLWVVHTLELGNKQGLLSYIEQNTYLTITGRNLE